MLTQISRAGRDLKVSKSDTGISSTKQMNTHGTLMLYCCIMSVALCCCLARCMIVPIAQASNYELNSRGHIDKLDKNAFIQEHVIN